MSIKPNIRPRRSMKNLFLCEKKKSKSSVNSSDLSPSSNLLAIDDVCYVPSSEDYHDLYKGRKTDMKCDFLRTNGNAVKKTNSSFTTYGDNFPRVQNSGGKSLIISSNLEVPKSEKKSFECTTKYIDPREASKESIWKNSSESLSNVDDRNSISISSMPSYINDKTKDATESSLSDTNATKPFLELTSWELCISMLKRDIIPIKKSEWSSSSATLSHDDNQSNALFACKSCGSLEDPCRMLICDCCEGAFHLHCCHRRIKKIPDKEWYCLDCSRKKHKRKREIFPSAEDGSAKHIQRPHRSLGSIRDMLMNPEPYDTQVRIGGNFQAEVPEWTGPISCSDDHFVEPSELDATEMTSPSWPQRREDKKSSIGNWIQCQEVLDTGAICGKWRRAPLFVVQSSDWDCSCSVLWDPIHADCAVPQELATDEVLEQLKYINKLKNRLDNCKKKH
ncbi:uncharacterized protein [Lolium perenne]|uniref:uncharacterized protein isoform X1 n=3 Tax=Lolium perenne TaxID=4522 RepID=UPI003A99AEB3